MISELPLTWIAVPLSAICEINPRTKSELKPDDLVSFVPMAAVSELSGTIVGNEIRPLAEVRKGFTQFQEGDVLFAKITPCMENGKAAIARDLMNGQGYGSTEFHVLRPSSLVMAEWLFAIIRTEEFRRAAAASFQGAVGQQRVTTDFLQRFRIPLPPLSEQRRIVAILQEAETVRRLRTQVEAKTAELIPALFASIFGELYSGTSPFPVSLLSEIGELDRGRSRHRPRDEPSLYGGPYPFLQTGDIAQSNGWVSTYNQTYSEKGLEQSKLWPKGTLAITIAANIGSTAILTFDACFPDSIVGFTPNEGISAEYVRWWLLGYQKKLEIQAPQGAQKNINLEVLRAIRIPVPPAELQMRFDEAVQNLREQITLNGMGNQQFTKLTASLAFNAFTGRLTTEWREYHSAQLNREVEVRNNYLATKKLSFTRKGNHSICQWSNTSDFLYEEKNEGNYSDLNREQRMILKEIKQMVGCAESICYFNSAILAEKLKKPPLRKNPQAIESHLAVLAVRGIIIAVSREEQTKDTGEYIYGNAYRLPLETIYKFLVDGKGPRVNEWDIEPITRDRTQSQEMERLVSLLEKGR